MASAEFPRPRETERIPENFWGKVERLQERGNYVSLGLDSDWSQIPQEYKVLGREEGQFQFNKDIIDGTHDLVCTYKPNLSFYFDSEEGERALKRTVDYIHQAYPGIPVLADDKLGDIGNTNDGWVRMLFDRFDFDATTVSPYMGGEALRPFLEQKNKGIVVVCKTSNPGGGEFQDLQVPIDDFTSDVQEKIELMRISGGTKIPVYMAVANRVSKHWNRVSNNCGLVVGATYPEQAEQIREIDPRMQFLVPGVGAQGADLQKAVATSMNVNNGGIVVNSSRAIIFARREQLVGGEIESVGQAARRETLKLHDEINYYREHPEGFTPSQEQLAHAFFDHDVLMFGEFTLKLHETNPTAPLSPVYVDQRILRSAPNDVKTLACLVIQQVIRDLKFDVYADTPTAITPLVSLLSYLADIPMITPRGEKTHGSGAIIDGKYEPGKTVALALDDVITSGASANEAVDKLRSAGVIVKDFVAFVNREQGGIQAIKANDVNPHWVYDLSNLLRFYKRTGRITKATYNRCVNYFKNA